MKKLEKLDNLKDLIEFKDLEILDDQENLDDQKNLDDQEILDDQENLDDRENLEILDELENLEEQEIEDINKMIFYIPIKDELMKKNSPIKDEEIKNGFLKVGLQIGETREKFRDIYGEIINKFFNNESNIRLKNGMKILQLDINTLKILYTYNDVYDIKEIDEYKINTSSQTYTIRSNLNFHRPNAYGYIFIWEDYYNKIGYNNILNKNENSFKNRILLKNKYPQLFKLLHQTKNTHIDIHTLTFASDQIVNWICEKGHEWSAKVSAKTQKGKARGCKKCYFEQKLGFTLEEKKEYLKNYISDISDINKGDTTEMYVYNLIKKYTLFNDVILNGSSGDKTDIIINVNNVLKSLQVKTLTINIKEYLFKFALRGQYDPNMLFFAINIEYKKYVLGFYKEFKDDYSVAFNFNDPKTKYKHMMYTDEVKLMDKFKELIKQSVDYKSTKSETTETEFVSMNYFTDVCKKYNLYAERNIESGNTVDLILNNIVKIQLKSKVLTNINPNTNLEAPLVFRMHKCAGKYKGKNIRRPYDSEDPFDFLIANVLGNDKDYEKFINDFLIIPKSVLVEKGILSIKQEGGKINLCSIVNRVEFKDHWTYQYWNRFDLLIDFINKYNIEHNLPLHEVKNITNINVTSNSNPNTNTIQSSISIPSSQPTFFPLKIQLPKKQIQPKVILKIIDQPQLSK
jgi:hypothetical protein